MKLIISFIITSIILGIVYFINDTIEGQEKTDVYYNTAVVIELGQCNKSDCSYTYKTSTGETRIGTTYGPVSLNQVVYQKCWTEKKNGKRCYVNYEPSKN